MGFRESKASRYRLSTQNRINGGSSDTDVKLFAVRPIGLFLSMAVMSVTPVPKQPSASRRLRRAQADVLLD